MSYNLALRWLGSGRCGRRSGTGPGFPWRWQGRHRAFGCRYAPQSSPNLVTRLVLSNGLGQGGVGKRIELQHQSSPVTYRHHYLISDSSWALIVNWNPPSPARACTRAFVCVVDQMARVSFSMTFMIVHCPTITTETCRPRLCSFLTLASSWWCGMVDTLKLRTSFHHSCTYYPVSDAAYSWNCVVHYLVQDLRSDQLRTF